MGGLRAHTVVLDDVEASRRGERLFDSRDECREIRRRGCDLAHVVYERG